MDVELKVKLCGYINEQFRPRHRSNREFALHCEIDEKTARLIQKEDYNLTVNLFKRICDAHNVKMSDVLIAIEE